MTKEQLERFRIAELVKEVGKLSEVFAAALLRRDGLELWKHEGIALADECYRLARSYTEAKRAFASNHIDELIASKFGGRL